MSLAPASRSRLHEVVLAACVLGCLANALRQREPRTPAVGEPAAETTADAVEGRAVEDRVDPGSELGTEVEDPRPLAR